MAHYDLPKRRRIFLMRHGDVTYFDDTGRAIDPESVPLNARGREEASAAGREFAAQNVCFDRVIASGLPRTIETAERVLAETARRRKSKSGRSGRRSAADGSLTFPRATSSARFFPCSMASCPKRRNSWAARP